LGQFCSPTGWFASGLGGFCAWATDMKAAHASAAADRMILDIGKAFMGRVAGADSLTARDSMPEGRRLFGCAAAGSRTIDPRGRQPMQFTLKRSHGSQSRPGVP
jgi:hypothetical protein